MSLSWAKFLVGVGTPLMLPIVSRSQRGRRVFGVGLLSPYDIERIVADQDEKYFENNENSWSGRSHFLVRGGYEKYFENNENSWSGRSHFPVRGGDVIATFEKIKTIIFVQAKFHKGKTSSWAIEQISDFMTSRAAMDDGYSKIS